MFCPDFSQLDIGIAHIAELWLFDGVVTIACVVPYALIALALMGHRVSDIAWLLAIVVTSSVSQSAMLQTAATLLGPLGSTSGTVAMLGVMFYNLTFSGSMLPLRAAPVVIKFFYLTAPTFWTTILVFRLVIAKLPADDDVRTQDGIYDYALDSGAAVATVYGAYEEPLGIPLTPGLGLGFLLCYHLLARLLFATFFMRACGFQSAGASLVSDDKMERSSRNKELAWLPRTNEALALHHEQQSQLPNVTAVHLAFVVVATMYRLSVSLLGPFLATRPYLRFLIAAGFGLVQVVDLIFVLVTLQTCGLFSSSPARRAIFADLFQNAKFAVAAFALTEVTVLLVAAVHVIRVATATHQPRDTIWILSYAYLPAHFVAIHCILRTTLVRHTAERASRVENLDDSVLE